jgi:dTMP kinase
MFITFEGIEGSGKSTALNALCELLRERGIALLHTREPGGSELGVSLRSLLLNARQEIVPEAELFLYLADRAQHVRHVIRPALGRNLLVLSDRYADSTIVDQGYGRGLDIERLYLLNEMAVGGLWPDCTVVFDLEPEVGLARARARNSQSGTDVTEGRFEAETLSFHKRIRQGYLSWAKRHPRRFRIVDAQAMPDAVFAELLNVLKGFLF